MNNINEFGDPVPSSIKLLLGIAKYKLAPNPYCVRFWEYLTFNF